MRIIKVLITLFLIIGFVFLIYKALTSYERASKGGQLTHLNNIRPQAQQMEYFRKTVKSHEKFDPAQLAKFIDYYKEVVVLYPTMADAYGMLGFCYAQVGDFDSAIAAYKQAIQLLPQFFWFHYNLGLIHFKKGDYKEAISVLNHALTADLENSLKFIASSQRIYLPLLPNNEPDFGGYLRRQMQQGYKDCSALLVLSYIYIENFTSALNVARFALESKSAEAYFLNYHAGFAAYRLKEFPRAVSYLQESIKQSLNFADAYYVLGLSLKELGALEPAEMMIKKAALLHQKEPQPIPVEHTIYLQSY